MSIVTRGRRVSSPTRRIRSRTPNNRSFRRGVAPSRNRGRTRAPQATPPLRCEGLVEGQESFAQVVREHVTQLAAPQGRRNPIGVLLQESFGERRVLGRKVQVGNDVRVDHDHGRPSSMAASISAALNSPGAMSCRSRRAREPLLGRHARGHERALKAGKHLAVQAAVMGGGKLPSGGHRCHRGCS